jgi:hypothetical protein
MGSKDVSKGQAKLQNKRLKLEQTINKKVFETQKIANEYQDKAVTDLNEGLGLLSRYIDTKVKSQKDINSMYQDMNNEDVPTLQAQARQGASYILDELGKVYGR